MRKKLIFALLMAAASMTAQDMKNVTGQVVDAATGKPLSGVMVQAYGDARYSTLTDELGNYVLKTPEYTRSIIIRVDGYNLEQCAVRDGVANGKLYQDTFGELYKTSTSATAAAEASNFVNTSEVSVDPLVAQQIAADVRTTTLSGLPGMGGRMLIGGINSLNTNSQPLVVIDGVIMDMQYNRKMLHDGYYNNMLANLNVNDIEKVTVLKNGTALYGAKAADGVILIQTKRNKSMATKIDVTINGRYEMVPQLPKMMDAEDYRLYTTELLAGKTKLQGKMKYLNNDPNYFYYKQYHNQTDWTKEVYENAFSQNYGINVQGGDNVASYNLSVGYSLGNSTLKKNDFSRFNMRLNSDIEVFRGLDVRFDASYSDLDRSLTDDGAPIDPLEGVITSPGFLGLAKAPFLSPYAYDKQGNLSHYLAEADDYLEGMFQGKGRLANPTSILINGDGTNRNSFGSRLIMFAITPTYRINRHLKVGEHFSLGLVNTNENYYLPIMGVPTFTIKGLDEGATLQNYVQSASARQTSIQSDTYLDWNHRYGPHRVNFRGGVRYLSSEYKSTWQRGYNTGNDKTPNMSNSLQFKKTGGADDKWKEIGWYGVAGYNYAERFYVDGGFSLQSSSRFGDDADGLKLAGVVWGLFPSIEAAWVLSNEKFLANLKALNYLKLNVGFDVTGNDAIDYTASRSFFVSNLMLNNEVTGLSIGNIGNTELKWETTRRVTAGLEANFLNNRVSLKANVFKSWTENLLALRQLAWTSGLEQTWTNGGKLENSGFDVSLKAKALALKNFQWEIGASVGHYTNEVTALPDGRSFETQAYGANILTMVGQPVGVFYGWKTNGVYENSAQAASDGLYVNTTTGGKNYFQAGDMRFVNLDDNKAIDDADKCIIGDPNPDFYGNIFTTLTWKRVSLSAVFNYSLGNDVFNYQRSLLEGGSLFLNQTTAMNNRWNTEGQVTSIPRVSYNDPMGNSRFSDRWIEDGSYLRLSSVTLSYHLPIISTYLQGITVWGNASNLFTLTKYLGSDPDRALPGSQLYQGIDFGYLAPGRTFSLGVNINL